MKKTISLIITTVFVLSLIPSAAVIYADGDEQVIPEDDVYEQIEAIVEETDEDDYDGFIFSLTDPESPEALSAVQKAIDEGIAEKVEFSENDYIVEDLDALQEIVPEEHIETIEPDYLVYMFDEEPEGYLDGGVSQSSAAEPNDKYYATYQYNIKDLNVPAVWEYGIEGQDFDDSIDMDHNGAADDDDIVVAVIDSGLKEGHEDIDWSRVITGISFADGTSEDDTNDTDGHGTFVTGIIAAAKDNDVGTAGILQKVKVMPVRVFYGESASDSVIVNAINYAAAQKEEFVSSNGTAGTNICVINMSLGSAGTSSAMDTACQRAMAAGILVVCAAGNDGDTTASYPAQYSMGVGSTNSSKTVSSYSQRLSSYNGTGYEKKVWVAAPGEGITSLYCENTKSYAQMSGTSFSSPEVAALGAICKSLKNDIDQVEFMELLKETADYKTGSRGDINGQDVEYGWGLVNFKNTVDQLISSQFGDQTGQSVLKVRVQNEAGSEITDPFVNIYELVNEGGAEVKGSLVQPSDDGTWILQKGRRYFYSAHAEKYEFKEDTFATLTEQRTLTITLQGAAYPVSFDIVNTKGESITVSSLNVKTVSGIACEPGSQGQFMLRNGMYSYTIEAPSYFDVTEVFTIDDIAEDMSAGKVIRVVMAGDIDVCSLQLRVIGDSEDGDITSATVIEFLDSEGREINRYKDGAYKLDIGTYTYTIYHTDYKTVKGTITVSAGDIGSSAVQNVAMNGKLYSIIFHIFPLSADPDVLIYDSNAEVYERQTGSRQSEYRTYRITDGTYYFDVDGGTRGTYKGTFTVNDGTVSTTGLKIGSYPIIEKTAKRDITINMQANSPDTVFTDNTNVPAIEDIVPSEPEDPGHVHKYVSEITKEATCTETGVRTWTCIAGDDSYTEEIPKTAHQFDADGVCVVCGTHDYDTIEDEDWLYLVDASTEEQFRKVSLTQLAQYMTSANYTMINSYYGTSYSYTVYGITFNSFIEHFVGKNKCVSNMHITAMPISENMDSYGNLYYVDLDRETMDNAMIAWYTINNSTGEERTGSEENNMRIVINNGLSGDWMYGPDRLYITYGEHVYSQTDVVEPTCTEQGYTIHTCENCGESYKTDITEAKGHVFDPARDIVTPPTETRRGFTTHICEVCGETVIDSYTDPSGAGHYIHISDLTRRDSASDTSDHVSDIDKDQLYNGETEFSITCDNPCVVIQAHEDGSYSLLACRETDGQHVFTVNVTDSDVYIMVVQRGDTDMNGRVTSKDATIVVKYTQLAWELDQAQIFAADVDSSNDIKSKDATIITRIVTGTYVAAWD